ncbi:MAG: hypothetical protein ACI861_000729 [Paracoccaceae bacterium]|jgi:uncharacterized protein (TIGR02302 family)
MRKPKNKPNRRIEISSTQIMLKAKALKSLRWPLLFTRLGMFAEQMIRAFWPLWSWVFVIWTALSFNLVKTLSVEAAYVLALAGVVGVISALVYGFRRFRWPSVAASADRIDRSLKDRPLTALWDLQAIGADDGASTAIWRAHVARMAEQAATAKRVEPNLKISDRDPYGLRFVAATALVVALLFGSFNRNAIDEILDPSTKIAASGPIYEGWIEPPRYTGLPGIYLNDLVGTDPILMPQGSKVTLRLYGEIEGLGFAETVSGQAQPPSDVQVFEHDFVIQQSGDLQITGEQGRVWNITMIPDTPPMIALTGPVERSPSGETKLTFQAADDYGVVGGTAVLSLDLSAVDRRYGLALMPETLPDIVLDIPLPFSGNTKDFTDTLAEDLSLHPWAGLPVILNMSVADDLEQSGVAEPETHILPGRRFFDPMAAAIIEQRRDLLWNRNNVQRITQVLRAISHLPEDIIENDKAYFILRTAIRRLEYRPSDTLATERRDEVADMLWNIALLIEEGGLGDARARLRRAEERLSEAIENGATDDEIAELMEELRRAMQEFMQELARDSEQNQDQARNSETREITSDQLQEMLDKIEELTREGRMEEAQEMLEQLRQMMENMQTAQRQQGEGEGEGEGQQSMRELADTMRQQQDLSDEAFRQMQEEFNGQQPGEQGQQGEGQQPGEPGANGQQRGGEQGSQPGPGELAQRQDALRQLLESQRNGLPDANSEEGRFARDALRRAEREMGEAGEALRQGDIPEALNNQADALDALREGLENLGQELAQNQDQNVGRQGDQAGSPDPNSKRDPLGRQTGTTGRIGSEQDLMPGDNPFMRSRELLDEIRRRSGDKSRPKIELDYLKRLLDRF